MHYRESNTIAIAIAIRGDFIVDYDWLLVEQEAELTLQNNKNDKRYELKTICVNDCDPRPHQFALQPFTVFNSQANRNDLHRTIH